MAPVPPGHHLRLTSCDARNPPPPGRARSPHTAWLRGGGSRATGRAGRSGRLLIAARDPSTGRRLGTSWTATPEQRLAPTAAPVPVRRDGRHEAAARRPGVGEQAAPPAAGDPVSPRPRRPAAPTSSWLPDRPAGSHGARSARHRCLTSPKRSSKPHGPPPTDAPRRTNSICSRPTRPGGATSSSTSSTTPRTAWPPCGNWVGPSGPRSSPISRPNSPSSTRRTTSCSPPTTPSRPSPRPTPPVRSGCRHRGPRA